MAAVELDGCVFLRRGAFRGTGTVRYAGDLQHGPGEPVHQHGVRRRSGERRGTGLDGRPWPVDGQRDGRKAVAESEVRNRLSERLRDGNRGEEGHRGVDRLLQRAASAFVAGRPYPR